jgi:hypothetical protein
MLTSSQNLYLRIMPRLGGRQLSESEDVKIRLAL